MNELNERVTEFMQNLMQKNTIDLKLVHLDYSVLSREWLYETVTVLTTKYME